MSLRTKLVLSIFAFLVLVFGLLTLVLWLDAVERSRDEARRNADLASRVALDLVRAWTAQHPATTGEGRARLASRFASCEFISAWTVVELKDDRLEVVTSSEPDPAGVVAAEGETLRAAFKEIRLERGGARLFVPLQTAQGDRFAARLDVLGPAAPGRAMVRAFRGTLVVMGLGTVLLLLNIVVFTNRLVLRPLDRLLEASGRVAQGDFTKKVSEERAYDEMGRLVRAFNLMIDKVADYHGRLQKDIQDARGRITHTERRLFAAQRLSTTGTLAAGIAHEINNPLGGMINAARSLRDGRLDRAKQEEYLELILDGLERVRAIVQKILQFRPRPFEPRPVDLREAVDKAVAFLDHRARAKEVEIRNDLPPGLPPVKGDPLELQQAFLNVLMNSVDACVLGEGRIAVSAAAAGAAVQVRVTDNGCGMTPGELARCMDPFFTTKDVGEGTGLGLAVAHNIVANHGGKLDLASEGGRGTTVTITLPLIKGASTGRIAET